MPEMQGHTPPGHYLRERGKAWKISPWLLGLQSLARQLLPSIT